jgi:hypothetical protein
MGDRLVFLNPTEGESPKNALDYAEARLRRAARDLWAFAKDQIGGVIVTAVLAIIAAPILVFLSISNWHDAILVAIVTAFVAPAVLLVGAFYVCWWRAPAKMHIEAGAPHTVATEPWHKRYFAILCVYVVLAAWAVAALFWSSEHFFRSRTEAGARSIIASLGHAVHRAQHLQGESDYRRILLWGGHGHKGAWHEIHDKGGLLDQVAMWEQRAHNAENKPPQIIYRSSPRGVPQSAPPPQQPEAPARDPDTIYQLGDAVATVQGADIDRGKGMISFENVYTHGDLNVEMQFEYRDYLMHFVSKQREIDATVAGQKNIRYMGVICQIMGKRN